MGLLELFLTASVPVLKMLLVTGVGSCLATGHVGILCSEARKHLNNVVFYVYNPALVSTNLSGTITMESMMLLWFMPLNILLTFIIGSAFGWIVIKITKAPSHLRGLILGCCAAGNLGNMLLIIIPAICKERGSPFGDPNTCRTFGLAYASLSMAIGAVFLWSYVYNIVRITSGTEQGKMNGNSYPHNRQPAEESEPLIQGDSSYGNLAVKNSSIPREECALVFSESGIVDTKPKVSFSEKTGKLWLKLSQTIDFTKIFAPSTIGVILGFIIGVIPQIRKVLIGENAPLRVIQDSANLLGEGAIPTITLIMGGNLIKGLQGSNIRFSIVLGVLVVRYIMLPLVGIIIVRAAINVRLLPIDPLYHFVLLIQYALPPAMNIGTITQLFGAGESECSVILLWSYLLASVSFTLWSTFFMWFVSTN